jgi:hypothetical protein
MSEKKSSKAPRSFTAKSESDTALADQLGTSSFPASDPPAVWTWEVPKVETASQPTLPFHRKG